MGARGRRLISPIDSVKQGVRVDLDTGWLVHRESLLCVLAPDFARRATDFTPEEFYEVGGFIKADPVGDNRGR
jgi:hypothetical protein